MCAVALTTAEKQKAGARIRDARLAKDWTQPELAERVAASTTTVSNWETGKTAPGLEDINPVCMALGISPDLLLSDLGIMLTPPAAARLPRELVDAALRLDATRLAGLVETARGLLLVQQGSAQRAAS